MDGSVDKSYGINVAKLALLPDDVIKEANEMLEVYESKSENKGRRVKQIAFDFTENKEDKLRDYLKTINQYEVTPIEAINILDKIKKISEE